MAASLIGGAAVGAVFGELLKAVLEIRGKAGMFKQTLASLRSILVAITPTIKEIQQHNNDLGRSKEELEWLIKEMEKGTELVRKCSEINRLNYVARVRYQDQLEEFIDSLVRFFTINMQAYTSRDQKETLLKVDRILSRVNKLPLVNPEDTAGEKAMENISQLAINSAEQAREPLTSIAHESTSKAENNQGMEHLMNEKSHEQPAKLKLFGFCLPEIGPVNREVKKATPKKHRVFCKACGIGIEPDLMFHDESDPYCIPCYVKQFPPNRLDCSYSFGINDSSSASVEVLGTGSYGQTYRVQLSNGREVAVKRLTKVVEQREFEKQVKIMQTSISKHPNVIPIRAYYYSKNEQLLFYDYIMPGGLYCLLHASLYWNFIMRIAHGAAVGIAHIHSAGMVHGNIKSSNILVTIDKMENVQGCISDFGLNRLTHDSVNPSRRNKGYQAPELVDNAGELTQKCDVYSFGVLLSEMLTGQSAAWQVPRLDRCFKEWTLRDPKNPDRRRQVSKMVDLASKCVALMPDSRPSMAEVVKEIKNQRIQ